MCEDTLEEDDVPLVHRKRRAYGFANPAGARQMVAESSMGPGDGDRLSLPSSAIILGEEMQASNRVTHALNAVSVVNVDNLRSLEDFLGISMMVLNHTHLPVKRSIENNTIPIEEEVECLVSDLLKEVYCVAEEEPRLKGMGTPSDWNLSLKLFFAIYHFSSRIKAMGIERDYIHS